MQSLVIFLRFGTLLNDLTPWMRATDVYLKTGVKMCTQLKIIRRWKQRGFTIVITKNKGREQLLKPEQVQWLIAPDTLQGMAHLSLERRCMIIKDKWNLPSFSTQTLRMCYRKHGVRYKRPDYTFWKNRAELRDLAGK